MASQQKSISSDKKQCSISSRICSPTVGRKGLYRRTSGMKSLSLSTKTREKKSDCSNYRGITLLSIAGKILVRVLLNRLILMLAQEDMPDSQCRFRSNRRTVDIFFVLRQIQEKCREQNMGLYAVFVDLTKAFDTVSRDGLWKILARLGCPRPSPQFLTILRQLHEG